MDKKKLGAKGLVLPIPSALIGAGNTNKPDIITVAWVGVISKNPPTVSISIADTRYSLQLIRNTKEFTVNIPSAENYKEVDYCGIVSGKDTNKFTDTGFTAIKGTKINAPIVKECPVNLECKVINEIKIPGRTIFFGEVIETYVDVDKYDSDNNSIIVEKVNPLAYCSNKEYWCLGNKVGDAFNSGKILKK